MDNCSIRGIITTGIVEISRSWLNKTSAADDENYNKMNWSTITEAK